jgi:hypothetical protein
MGNGAATTHIANATNQDITIQKGDDKRTINNGQFFPFSGEAGEVKITCRRMH